MNVNLGLHDWVLRKGKQFLLHYWHPSYVLYFTRLLNIMTTQSIYYTVTKLKQTISSNTNSHQKITSLDRVMWMGPHLMSRVWL
jgi:hypothetical protein